MTERRSAVMRLGPIDREGGVFFEYVVFPGREGRLQYFAADDDEAFAQIRFDYDARELSCEEALAAPGARAGVPAGALGDAARHGLSLFAMDRFPERPFSNLTEEMLVFHYLGAARSLLAAPYREAASLDQPLALAIGGSLSFETIVHVDRAAPAGEPLVTMLMEPATGLGRRRPVPAERLEPFDRLTVSLSEGPAFVRDALARAHDLAAIPVPWRFVSGARSAVADMQLAILTTILAALSELAAGADRATASLALGGHRVDALLGPLERPPRAPKARKAAAKETASKKAAPKKAAPKKAAPKKAAPKKAAPKKAAPKKAAPKKRKPAKGRRGA